MTTPEQPFYRRRGFVIAAIVVAIPVLAVGWYLFSPLFLNRTVEEEFPRAAMAAVPADMTAEQVEQEMIDAEGDNVESSEDMPEADPVAIVTGTIVGADSFHQGSGTATVYELADGTRILRLEDLDVTNGPDLHVLLSPVAAPASREQVTAEGYIDLGGLKGNRGSQNYEIPPDFEIGDELSVVIYCQPFHVIFSTATLAPA